MLVSNVDHSGTKLDADGQVMHRLEALIRELKEQTGFANTYGNEPHFLQSHPTSVSNNNVLEEVRI